MTVVRKVEGQEVRTLVQDADVDFHGAKVNRLVREYMQRTGEKSYSAALAKVTKANPTLAREYAGVDREKHRADTQDAKFDPSAPSLRGVSVGSDTDSDAADDAQED